VVKQATNISEKLLQGLHQPFREVWEP